MAAYEGFAELETKGWSDDTISSGYVTMFSEASDKAIPSIVASIDSSNGRILDLCCGQGNVTEAIAKAGHTVTGADFSAKMLSHARERFPTGEFIEADAQNLPFKDGSFDSVVCSFGLMHVPDQPKALSEIHRVLKPNGQFIMTSWCGPDVSPVFQVFYSSVQEHGDPSVKMPDSPNFHQFANEEAARSILSDAGFDLETQKQIDCFWILDSPAALAEIFQNGAPRGGYLLSQQPAANNSAIKAAVAEKVRERFGNGDKWHAPLPASMIVARAR
ncbi:class I SAM-dependent methyltransferase [Aestuariivita boseongensis]|uniref:class I SAM-dependent methyltransferase n=1 Tax=Aestuariivita boseongensis TaxID=1470562 RepID=UPI0006820735|nr:methyltransferase domain-containing protein [Aestuariivita boseongensis]